MQEVKLNNPSINEGLRKRIEPFIDHSARLFFDGTTAVLKTLRSEYGSSGGIGYYDQIRVFHGEQSALQEWQWRDRWSAAKDRFDLVVHEVKVANVSEKDGVTRVEVELVNTKYGNRIANYTFEPSATTLAPTLSADEQAAFSAKAEQELERVMADLKDLWKRKPKMPNRHATSIATSYTSYRQPSVKQREFRPEFGIAAFITEEQIDHRVSDPQIRYALHVLTAGADRAVQKDENHGYEEGEGGAFLTILEIAPGTITINSTRGKETITL